LHKQNDTVYLINFWATWCGPCRKEMPAIEAIGEKYKSNKFKILLVSLDFRDQLDISLLPYLKANAIKSEVVLLDDPRQDHWIDNINHEWEGDLPYTIIYGPNFRDFYTQAFTFHELDSIIHPKLTQP
jgi:thiol-disulfide isomerase/thioredoxin